MFASHRLRRTGWNNDVDGLAAELFAIFETARLGGIDGPLKINTTGTEPSMVFNMGPTGNSQPIQIHIGDRQYATPLIEGSFTPLTPPGYTPFSPVGYGNDPSGGLLPYPGTSGPGESTPVYPPFVNPAFPAPPPLTTPTQPGSGATPGSGTNEGGVVGLCEIVGGAGKLYDGRVSLDGGEGDIKAVRAPNVHPDDRLPPGTLLPAYGFGRGSSRQWYVFPPVWLEAG